MHDPKEHLSRLPMPFGDFTGVLKRRGFVIGVGHYIRAKAVLERFGPHRDPETLKYALCPVFATHEKQQDLFYRLYDEYFNLVPFADAGAVASHETDFEDTPARVRKLPYALAGMLAFLVLAVACFYLAPPTEVRPAKTKITEKTKVSEKRLPNLVFEIPLKTAPPELSFFERHGRFFRLAASFAAPLVCLFYTLYRIGRRRPALAKGGGKPPPYYLPIRTDRQRPGYLARRRFFDAANRLRVRIRSEVFRLDPDRTISATVKKGGFPDLRYRAVTRPAEYLFLVDLKTADDHYAHFMGTTAGALANEGIFADVWYFAEDPRICFQNPGEAGVRIEDLRTKYADRRLAVVGECDAFLNPVTGRLDEWIGTLSKWRERAILTPRRPRNWGMREVALAVGFVVLPATLDGLGAMASHFEFEEDSDLPAWTGADTAPADPGPDAAELKSKLDRKTFEWLCACAVYPELNFSLTLHLGTLLHETITEARLLELVRIPWFRLGAIPDPIRTELVAEIEPDRLKTVREAIYGI